ncbi:MAG TPA: ABC transporter substrate-binding protein [Thermomicrobiales bacterium]|nr:ABC transporter substrate-binding protein [Thermomicrobiales bacterium]
MRVSRRRFVAGSAVSLPAMAFALQSGQAFAADKTTLNFPYLWTGPEGDAMQKIVDDFNASQDEIEVKGVANPDVQRQIAMMAAKKGFDISDSWDTYVGGWAGAGAIMPLDDLIAGASYDTSDFVPEILNMMKFDDQIYAMPVAVHTVMLMYNKDLLSEAGVEPPQTIEELKDAIDKLTKVGDDGKITQLGLNAPDFVSFSYSFGGQWIDENLQPTANAEGNVEALSFWVDNVLKKYGVDEIKRFQSGFGEYASPQNPFYTGKVAMVMDGEWQAMFIQQYAEELNWGVTYVPVPEAKPELEQTAALSASMFFIPANTSNAEASWTFMDYLVSPDPMRDFTLALANLPARTSLLDDDAYAEIPGMNYWLESLKSPNLKFMPQTAWRQEYATEITSTVEQITNLKQEPKEALDALQEKALKIAAK